MNAQDNFLQRFQKCSLLMKIVFGLFFIGGNAVLGVAQLIGDFSVFWYALAYNALVLVLFILMIKWSRKF